MLANTGGITAGTQVEKSSLNSFLGKYKSLLIFGVFLAGLVMVFDHYSDGVFLTPRNFSLLLRQASIVGIVATGVAILIVMSEIDLSIGSAVYLVGVAAATAETQWNLGIVGVIGTALAVGITLGAWQGFWVAKVGVPSFIVTLAGLLSFRGIGLYLTDARTISPLSESHIALSEGFLSTSLTMTLGALVALVVVIAYVRRAQVLGGRGEGAAARRKYLSAALAVAFIAAFTGTLAAYRGAPTAIIWTLVIGGGLWFLMSQTVFGRNAYMIGANRLASQLAGIRVSRNVFVGFVLMGALYGVAGVLFTARLGASTAGDATFMELDAIAAAVIGGVALRGGKGRIPVVLGGALLLSLIDNGMSVMGVSSFLQQIVKGSILLAAVALDARSRRA